jgi:hypothetical protein
METGVGNPGQGEPPFTGDGLSQARYRFLVPPKHVFVQGVQFPHQPQFPFTNRKMIAKDYSKLGVFTR